MAFDNVHDRWLKVLDIIIKEGGYNEKVEKYRGAEPIDLTFLDKSEHMLLIQASLLMRNARMRIWRRRKGLRMKIVNLLKMIESNIGCNADDVYWLFHRFFMSRWAICFYFCFRITKFLILCHENKWQVQVQN